MLRARASQSAIRYIDSSMTGRAGGRSRLELSVRTARAMAVTTRTHFTFRVDTWSPDGESIVEHVAGVEDYQVALATYRAACERWPGTPITLRQGARVIEEGQPAPAHGAGRWRSQSLEPRRPWSGISRNACLMGCSCRTFREEHSPRPGCLPGGSPPSTL